MNELQNGVIFKCVISQQYVMYKIQLATLMEFLLRQHHYCDFCWMQSVNALFLPAVFFHNSQFVKHNKVMKKSARATKNVTNLIFHISIYHPNSLHYRITSFIHIFNTSPKTNQMLYCKFNWDNLFYLNAFKHHIRHQCMLKHCAKVTDVTDMHYAVMLKSTLW